MPVYLPRPRAPSHVMLHSHHLMTFSFNVQRQLLIFNARFLLRRRIYDVVQTLGAVAQTGGSERLAVNGQWPV